MASHPGGEIVWVDRTLFEKMDDFVPKFDRVVQQVMRYNAIDAQNHMRSNAPWTDRTGNARQGLFTQNGSDGGKHFIVLYHTVDYGIWLETRWAGKYAIVAPTTQKTGIDVMNDLRRAMSMMGAAS